MTNRKILVVDPPHSFLLDALKGMGLEADLHYKTSREELIAILPQYAGLIIRSRIQVDRPFLDAGSSLQFIARYGVGTEHIDLEYAAQKNITVFTSPEGSMDTVGEHAVGMLLMLMNNLSRADREIREGIWRREPNRGVEIKGKVVGILGYGNMGKSFARRISGFEAESVIAYDKYKENYGDQYADEVDLQILFEKSDILSIHIPYSADNHYFIDAAFLASFQKPFYLINTARGLVLNTEALVRALEEKKVLGAALDVIEYEDRSFASLELSELPEPFHYLCQSDRVVMAPHIAGWSMESKLGHARVLADKIKKFLHSY